MSNIMTMGCQLRKRDNAGHDTTISMLLCFNGSVTFDEVMHL